MAGGEVSQAAARAMDVNVCLRKLKGCCGAGAILYEGAPGEGEDDVAIHCQAHAAAVQENIYVEAARAVAGSHRRVIFRHILPNVMAPFLIMLTAQLGTAILVEAS